MFPLGPAEVARLLVQCFAYFVRGASTGYSTVYYGRRLDGRVATTFICRLFPSNYTLGLVRRFLCRLVFRLGFLYRLGLGLVLVSVLSL